MLKEKKDFFKFKVICKSKILGLANLKVDFSRKINLRSEDDDSTMVLDCSDRTVVIAPKLTSIGCCVDIFIENQSPSTETIEYYLDEGFFVENINTKITNKSEDIDFYLEDVYESCPDMEVDVQLTPKMKECLDYISNYSMSTSQQELLRVYYNNLNENEEVLDFLHSIISMDLSH